MPGSFDCIVIGVGAVGSAALLELAGRGARVLGIDRFPPGHDRGSSHGLSRLIRLAYFEHPAYVPLLRRAYAAWRELEAKSGERLLTITGLLQVGAPEGRVFRGVLASAREHGLAVQRLDGTALAERFPGFGVPDGLAALLDAEAGVLAPERCVRAQAREAVRRGAELRTESVLHWRAGEHRVEVETDSGRYGARRLVLAPGAWAPALLGDLGVRFEVRRKSLFWYAATDRRYARDAGCPAFLFELGARSFYGFPASDPLGLKVAEHSGGALVEEPLSVDRAPDPAEARAVESFLRAHLPGVSATRTRHEVCLYTMTPDQHFVLGRHPGHSNVALAAGLSGHGFKFAPVLGSALADLALDGRTDLPIGFLAPDRPALARGTP